MEEIWRRIDEYPEYEVSNMGRVRSIDRDYVDSCGRKYHKIGQMIKLEISEGKDGYVQVLVSIWSQKKMHRLLVHRLVAKAFIPNPNNLPQINHKDEDTTNNHVDNLEWCDSKYNVNYGTGTSRRAKSKSKRINVYDKNYNLVDTVESGMIASKKYNISRGNLSDACHNHRLAKGFYFEFDQ